MGHDERPPAPGGEGADLGEDLDAVLEVEEGGGLVEEQDFRVLDQRSGEEGELTLAAGEARDLAVGEISEPQAIEGFAGESHVGIALEAEQRLMRGTTHQDELTDPERKGHVEVLGYEGDAPGQSSSRKGRDVLAAQRHTARSRGESGGGDPQKGRLPDAVATDQAHDLAGVDGEVETREQHPSAHLRTDVFEAERRAHASGPRAWARRSR